jgi:hypothetical protein
MPRVRRAPKAAGSGARRAWSDGTAAVSGRTRSGHGWGGAGRSSGPKGSERARSRPFPTCFYDRGCNRIDESSVMIEIFGRSTFTSGLKTRQLTFFPSTAFLTALSRGVRTDPPVFTSMNTISTSSIPASSPLKAIRSIGVPRKRMSLGSRSKPGK